jgi:hypothetical protein
MAGTEPVVRRPINTCRDFGAAFRAGEKITVFENRRDP